MKIYTIIFTALFCIADIQAEYKKPSEVSDTIWELMVPYFLPEDHPMKDKLDTIFHTRLRALRNSNTLKKAGFTNVEPGDWNGTIIASHESLEGYLVKMFTDEQTNMVDWNRFLDRVRGSLVVRKTITSLQMDNVFKVPNKWIYPLPAQARLNWNPLRKNFILLVEDMDLIGKNANLKKWKRAKLSKQLLNQVYILLTKAGLRDSAYAFNLPFSVDGKIAIVDTEYHNIWPVNYRALLQYLSPQNRDYWKQLIQKEMPHFSGLELIVSPIQDSR